jgi:transposase
MPKESLSRILRLPGYGVWRWELDEEALQLRLWIRQNGREPSYTCSGCGIERRSVHDEDERLSIRDLPWGTWTVYLVVEVHRVKCPQCGVKVECLGFVEGKRRHTVRLAKAVARDCEDAPTNRVATKWKLSAQTVRRIDKRALQSWKQGRKQRALRHMGVDELFWRKGRCLTVVSDLERGEPIWAGPERKKETLDRFFAEEFPPRRRRWVRAVCVDMWEPYRLSLREHLPRAAIVYDKFHVMKHVNHAIDETRRQEFFRQGGRLRSLMRGKRWLLLTRRSNLSRRKRGLLNEALSLNRRLFKAYYLKEQIDRLWSYTYEGAARRFFEAWVRSLRWQRLPAFKKLARTLETHLDGILAYCRHKVPFGVVEAINGNLRAVIRRGRGYRDHEYLILKAAKATAQRRLQNAA